MESQEAFLSVSIRLQIFDNVCIERVCLLFDIMAIGKKIATNSKGLQKLSSEDLSHLQSVEFLILKDVAKCCDQHHISCLLFYGTLLGAVRHLGFIPWDDDIDLIMPKNSLDNFVKSLNSDYPNKYYINGLNYGLTDDPFTGIKVELVGTECIEPGCECFPHKRGINIDIFPVAETPRSYFRRMNRGRKLVLLRRIIGFVMCFNYPPKNMLHNPDKKIRFFYELKSLLGFFFSFKSISGWMSTYRKCLFREYPQSPFVCCSDDFGNFSKAGIPLNFDEKANFLFCGSTFYSVKDYQFYLKACYGPDFMKMPQIEDRETHAFIHVDFGKY